MKITTTHAQVTTQRTSKGEESFVNIAQTLSGYGVQLDLYGRFLVCRERGGAPISIIAVPSKEWDADIIGSGTEVIGQLTAEGFQPL